MHPASILARIHVLGVLALVLVAPGWAIPAFPGAEGFGRNTVGGRGGRVIAVTNLNDSGPGSFRAAVRTAGARTVVFRVGGLIRLESTCEITEPFLTIAGQTAPGDGILFTGDAINIRTSEVIVRNIRRRYDGAERAVDGIGIVAGGEELRNVILDHCSISWGTDENIGINGVKGGARDITIQRCIIAEGLTMDAGHSMGVLLNGWKDFDHGPLRISLYRNLFANNHARNPMIGPGISAEVVNNVVYHWRTAATTVGNGTHTHFIGNHFKAGPSTVRPDRVIDFAYVNDFSDVRIFLKGNIGAIRPDNSLPEHAIVSSVKAGAGANHPFISVTPVLRDGITAALSAAASVEDVLAHAGAFPRDIVDRRQIDSFNHDSGRFVRHPSEVGGVPDLTGGPSPVDTDNDGMPDAWETAHGHNPEVDDGAEDADGDGYTNLEDYLNSFFTI